MIDKSVIRQAIDTAVAYLESAQLPSGEIPIEISPTADMSGDCVREPVVFPAAVAARALAITSVAERVRSRALDFLLHEMESGGLWRHPSSDKSGHHYTPLDLDDTAIASAALVVAGRPFPNNRDVLVAQREKNGLFRTWMPRWWRHPIMTYRFFKYVAKPHDIDSVINANVVAYLGLREETRPAIDHMLAILRSASEMTSTIWYGSRFTVWYFFSHALRDIAPEAGDMIVPRVTAATPGNALELAVAATTLLLWDRSPDIEPLLAAQLPSGSWPSVGFYHMGQRAVDASPKPPWWGSEALTTVFAVEALARYLKSITEPN
jgi:hypothetical protein